MKTLSKIRATSPDKSEVSTATRGKSMPATPVLQQQRKEEEEKPQIMATSTEAPLAKPVAQVNLPPTENNTKRVVAHLPAVPILQQKKNKESVDNIFQMMHNRGSEVTNYVPQRKSLPELNELMLAYSMAQTPKLLQTTQGRLSSSNVIQRVNTPYKPSSTELTLSAQKAREKEIGNDLSPEERYWEEVIFSGGLVYKKTGVVDGRLAQARLVDGKVIFAYSTNGQIYIRSEKQGVPRADGFTHANFLKGDVVQTAGQMFIRGGQIVRLDNESGHYQPHSSTLEWLLPKLQQEGVQLSKVMLVLTSATGSISYKAQDYLTTPNLEEVQLIDPALKVEDEEFQTQYDAHIGNDTIKFDRFGWPYSKLRAYAWNAKMKLIAHRCQLGENVTIQIEFLRSEQKLLSGEPKTKVEAIKALEKLLDELHLIAGHREVNTGASANIGLLTLTVKRENEKT